MHKIEPTTKKEKDEPYILEDKDYILIEAIKELTYQIKVLGARLI